MSRLIMIINNQTVPFDIITYLKMGAVSMQATGIEGKIAGARRFVQDKYIFGVLDY